MCAVADQWNTPQAERCRAAHKEDGDEGEVERDEVHLLGQPLEVPQVGALHDYNARVLPDLLRYLRNSPCSVFLFFVLVHVKMTKTTG